MTASRRKAREVAFQMLHQVDVNPDVEPEAVCAMIREQIRSEPLRGFAWKLFSGVMEFRPMLDQCIEAIAENWTLKRMAPTDRNVLRLGAYELMHTDTPYQVVIDEAIEVAKRFGSANSAQFVNGILDRIVPGQNRTEIPIGKEQTKHSGGV